MQARYPRAILTSAVAGLPGQSGGSRNSGPVQGPGAAGRPLLPQVPGARKQQARRPRSALDAEAQRPEAAAEHRPQPTNLETLRGSAPRTQRPKALLLTSDPGSPISPTA